MNRKESTVSFNTPQEARRAIALAEDPGTSSETLTKILEVALGAINHLIEEIEYKEEQPTKSNWAGKAFQAAISNPNLELEPWMNYAPWAPSAAVRNPGLPMFLVENPRLPEIMSPVVLGALVAKEMGDQPYDVYANTHNPNGTAPLTLHIYDNGWVCLPSVRKGEPQQCFVSLAYALALSAIVPEYFRNFYRLEHRAIPSAVGARKRVADNPNATEQQLERLAKRDPKAALANPNVSPALFYRLALEHPIAAMQSPMWGLMRMTAPDTWASFLDDPNLFERLFAQMSDQLPWPERNALACDLAERLLPYVDRDLPDVSSLARELIAERRREGVTARMRALAIEMYDASRETMDARRYMVVDAITRSDLEGLAKAVRIIKIRFELPSDENFQVEAQASRQERGWQWERLMYYLKKASIVPQEVGRLAPGQSVGALSRKQFRDAAQDLNIDPKQLWEFFTWEAFHGPDGYDYSTADELLKTADALYRGPLWGLLALSEPRLAERILAFIPGSEACTAAVIEGLDVIDNLEETEEYQHFGLEWGWLSSYVDYLLLADDYIKRAPKTLSGKPMDKELWLGDRFDTLKYYLVDNNGRTNEANQAPIPKNWNDMIRRIRSGKGWWGEMGRDYKFEPKLVRTILLHIGDDEVGAWKPRKSHPSQTSFPEDRMLPAARMMTPTEVEELAERDPVRALLLPECPFDLWWDLARRFPVEARDSALFPVLMIETANFLRWQKMMNTDVMRKDLFKAHHEKGIDLTRWFGPYRELTFSKLRRELSRVRYGKEAEKLFPMAIRRWANGSWQLVSPWTDPEYEHDRVYSTGDELFDMIRVEALNNNQIINEWPSLQEIVAASDEGDATPEELWAMYAKVADGPEKTVGGGSVGGIDPNNPQQHWAPFDPVECTPSPYQLKLMAWLNPQAKRIFSALWDMYTLTDPTVMERLSPRDEDRRMAEIANELLSLEDRCAFVKDVLVASRDAYEKFTSKRGEWNRLATPFEEIIRIWSCLPARNANPSLLQAVEMLHNDIAPLAGKGNTAETSTAHLIWATNQLLAGLSNFWLHLSGSLYHARNLFARMGIDDPVGKLLWKHLVDPALLTQRTR